MSQEVMKTESAIINSIILLSNQVVHVVELFTLLAALREQGQSAEDVAKTLAHLKRNGAIKYYETKFGLLIGLTGGKADEAVLSWISCFLPTHLDMVAWFEEC